MIEDIFPEGNINAYHAGRLYLEEDRTCIHITNYQPLTVTVTHHFLILLLRKVLRLVRLEKGHFVVRFVLVQHTVILMLYMHGDTTGS